MSFLDKYSRDEISNAISSCNSFAETLQLFGVSATSSINRVLLSQYIKDNQIDISHFLSPNAKYSSKDIFIEHSKVTQSTLRKYYKRGNYSDYKCAICGLPPFWNGQELVLTLDHINGKNDDHRLENLRWICPNCDLQLPTHGSKRLKIDRNCQKCGKTLRGKRKTNLCKDCYCETILKNPNSQFHTRRNQNHTCLICGTLVSKEATYCISCFHKTSRKASRPEPLELAKMIVEQGFEATGKYFGVSDKAISKWCKAYDIPTNKKDLVNWYNTQMGIDAESKKTKTSIMPIAEVIRPVNQIDMKTNEIINTFANISEAGRHLGKSNGTHIGEVCNGKRKSAYGYYWEFA